MSAFELERELVTAENERVTVAEYLTRLRRVGHDAVRAANRAGVHRSSLWQWFDDAAKAQKMLAVRYDDPAEAMEDPGNVLSGYQRACISFVKGWDRAWAEYVAELHQSLHRLAMGGVLQERTVEKWETSTREDGSERSVLVERKVSRSHTLPDSRALMTLLAAASPGEFGPRVTVEMERSVQVDGGEELARLLDVYQQGIEDQKARAIETSVVDRNQDRG